MHFAAASFSQSARLTSSEAQTFLSSASVELTSIRVPSEAKGHGAPLFWLRATVESLSSVHSSSTVAELPRWMAIARAMSAKSKAFSFPVMFIFILE